MKEKSEPTPPGENVFEVDRIRALVKLMEEHDLSEIDLRESRHRIRICRGQQVVLASSPAMSAPAHAPPPVASAASGSAGPTAPPADAGNFKYIKSPMVGTYYARPNPKAEAYVKVGDVIDATTVICIIEAMKVFNEIPAEIRGKVVEILVQDGEAVEFEKPLFKIEAK